MALWEAMVKFVLAIDDEPRRYWRLARTLAKFDIGLVVTCRMEEVRFYLCEANYQICGVLLDHDMPFQDGAYFVDSWLRERSIPVVVSSHNQPAAERLRATLDEWAVPVICAPAVEPGHSRRDLEPYLRWERMALSHFQIQHGDTP